MIDIDLHRDEAIALAADTPADNNNIVRLGARAVPRRLVWGAIAALAACFVIEIGRAHV
mgnify:CR=1 FL=1